MNYGSDQAVLVLPISCARSPPPPPYRCQLAARSTEDISCCVTQQSIKQPKGRRVQPINPSTVKQPYLPGTQFIDITIALIAHSGENRSLIGIKGCIKALAFWISIFFHLFSCSWELHQFDQSINQSTNQPTNQSFNKLSPYHRISHN